MTRLSDGVKVVIRCIVRPAVSLTAWMLLALAVPNKECRAGQAPQAEMLRYRLACSIDGRNASAECSAEIWIRVLRDSVGVIRFRLSPSLRIYSVTDLSDADIRYRIIQASGSDQSSMLECALSALPGVNDSLFFHIRYAAHEDTSAESERFIAEQDFVLQATAHSTWVPLLEGDAGRSTARRHAPAVIELSVPSAVTVLSGGVVDSLRSQDERTVWKITRTDASTWQESFCIAGSSHVTRRGFDAKDPAVCGIALYTPEPSFDAHFADAILAHTADASRYFASQGWRSRFGRITFAAIGRASASSEPVVSGSFVLVRTGPEHAVFDSSVFVSSAHNPWLLETARAYAFDVPDSSFWFNESWTGYCATRYLFATGDTSASLQAEERAHILSHALDFFPSQPVGAGRTDGRNEDAIFTYKGRYIFMMLEYVMGREAFDRALAMLYRESVQRTPSIGQFLNICERAYGSPLAWFFDEWLYRSGFPELVLSSKTEPTVRGAYEASVTVTQRGELFMMPIDVHILTRTQSLLKRIFVSQAEQRFTFMLMSEPVKIEWNPQHPVLRWVSRYRILAHARTSAALRIYDRDLAGSEREAHLTLQLDPANSTGAAALALHSLGMASAARSDWMKAEEWFLEGTKQHAAGELSLFPVLCAVHRANLLDLAGRREEALAEYRRVLDLAERDPIRLSRAVTEARRYAARPFGMEDARWYDAY